MKSLTDQATVGPASLFTVQAVSGTSYAVTLYVHILNAYEHSKALFLRT